MAKNRFSQENTRSHNRTAWIRKTHARLVYLTVISLFVALSKDPWPTTLEMRAYRLVTPRNFFQITYSATHVNRKTGAIRIDQAEILSDKNDPDVAKIKQLIEDGKTVDINAWTKPIINRLRQSDCRRRGWILEGTFIVLICLLVSKDA